MLSAMVNIKEISGLNCVGKQKKKKQIILTHTSRNLEDYLAGLKYRFNGKYNKIPNFVIGIDGTVYQLLPETGYSNFFPVANINRNAVIVSLENFGWLEKKPLTDYYVNWIGDIYKQKVFEKKWRDYFFWHPYSDLQIDACAQLCKALTDTLSIDKKCVGHNTKVDRVEKFEGIVSKSNFNSEYTGLSPAFNFEAFQKKMEHEYII